MRKKTQWIHIAEEVIHSIVHIALVLCGKILFFYGQRITAITPIAGNVLMLSSIGLLISSWYHVYCGKTKVRELRLLLITVFSIILTILYILTNFYSNT